MSIEHEHHHTEDDPYSLTNLSQLAKERMLAQGWHAPTLLVAGSKERGGGHFDAFPPTHEGRMNLMSAAGEHFGERDVVGALHQVIFITEAWISVLPHGELFRQPSQYPDRIEVLCLSRLDVSSQQLDLLLFQIVRDADEQIVDLPVYHVDSGKNQQSDSPLLRAFVEGYTLGRAKRNN